MGVFFWQRDSYQIEITQYIFHSYRIRRIGRGLTRTTLSFQNQIAIHATELITCKIRFGVVSLMRDLADFMLKSSHIFFSPSGNNIVLLVLSGISICVILYRVDFNNLAKT